MEDFQIRLPPLPSSPNLPPQWKQGLIWPQTQPPACWDSCSDDLGSPQVPWIIYLVNITILSFSLNTVVIPGQIIQFKLQFDSIQLGQ